ncbi:MAG TPA: TlpA disulfide reductase family protein [Flavisolibacter sp.]|jgi:peroxiredoxin|nr:TlpA disulfide reductase family protein [Flavisolibacter sp.]
MKKIFGIVILAGMISCGPQEGGSSFEVTGKVKNAAADMVYLEENTPDARPTILDSATLKEDGSFSLKTKNREESLYQLRLKGKVTPFAFFINDASRITVDADLNNTTQPYTVNNSPATKSLLDFDKAMYERGMLLFTHGNKVDSLQKAGASDSAVGAAYAHVQATAQSLEETAKDYLANSKSPVLSLYVISSYQNTVNNLGLKGFSKTEISELVTKAADKFPAHTALQNVKKSLPSSKAADFTQPDVNGQPVSLSQFKGKYVLVDFWASWCQPCRQENPNIVKNYNQFKDKNFTILGVSLDQNKDAWLKAIQQDGLAWTHVSDLKFWNNEAATLYGVQSIPYNVLVDPEGNIVAENLHGEELGQTLRKVLQ